MKGKLKEIHFRKNIFFRRDADGNPIWTDSYVYAMLVEDLMGEEQS